MANGIESSNVRDIRTLFYYLTIKDNIHKDEDVGNNGARVVPAMSPKLLQEKFTRRIDVCRFVVSELFRVTDNTVGGPKDGTPIHFSLVGLLNAYREVPKLGIDSALVTIADVTDALLYLSKIGSIRLEGGFLVLYNGMEIQRLVSDNRIRYKAADYRMLDEFYKQRIRQIHIVGEFANLMVRNYDAALKFVHDYFQLDFREFISKYFEGERAQEIDRNITPGKYNELFDQLSGIQSEIVNDQHSKYIVVAAGPGSGKTRVLVHKLASLLLLEDVKHEQLLMLTFSRAAATEFKKRLIALIGNAASFVEIRTFHSYCFDLLGKVGGLEGADDVVKNASEMIDNGEVEPGKIMKKVLVIDEAQDMDENEFALIQALIGANGDMRVIAVGDDDQNIYAFRGSDSKYLRALIDDYSAITYEMEENYRSKGNIVALCNEFIAPLPNRMKLSPIRAVQTELGTVDVTRHASDHIEEPLANHVAETYQGGKACVLTSTNHEALLVQSMLAKKGIRARLIQSNDGFTLYNLAEVRFFLKTIDDSLRSPVIDDSLWSAAKRKLSNAYADSSCLPNCLNMLADFESVTRTKFRTDLDVFIKESSYDDFCASEGEAVYVSTIHKSKGREFDAVYLLLKDVFVSNDEERRKVYVAMTRAKDSLYIHCNTGLFDNYAVSGIVHKKDATAYDEPLEIFLQLTHRDVVLNFFKDKKETILRLRGGSQLTVTDNFLFADRNGRHFRVAKFSSSFVDQLENLRKRGYAPIHAEVGFVVAWRGEGDGDESAIILPTLTLVRSHAT